MCDPAAFLLGWVVIVDDAGMQMKWRKTVTVNFDSPSQIRPVAAEYLLLLLLLLLVVVVVVVSSYKLLGKGSSSSSSSD